MARSVIILLLLAICFLTGVVYGNQGTVNKEQESIASDKTEEITLPSIEKINKATSEENSAPLAEVEAPAPVTEKTASILEASITGFYEIVVEILYQISQLFF
ncbi:hypothetical protein [Virgibacillus proomii]|uniref:hypothetical protein n=1 Tax=Virgibacillus proomii TaxID=84407 RepID=UPI001C11F418|nr:hypothetical protein [Virgibacillus proomii]MBU5265869.1 hypothetical protein [Virgibacillus proomii]